MYFKIICVVSMIHCASKRHSVEQNPLHDTTNNINPILPRITEKTNNTEANKLITRLYNEVYTDLDVILDNYQKHTGKDTNRMVVGLLNKADTIFIQLAENVPNEDKETNEIIQSYIKKANDFLFDKYQNTVGRQIILTDLYVTIKSINIEYKKNVEVSVTPKEFYMICSLYAVELENSISQKITKDMMQRQKEHAYEIEAQDYKKKPIAPTSNSLNIEKSNSNTINITNIEFPNLNLSPEIITNIGAEAFGSYIKAVGLILSNLIEQKNCCQCWKEKCDMKTKDEKEAQSVDMKQKTSKDDEKPATSSDIKDDEKLSTSSGIKDEEKNKFYNQHTPNSYLDEVQDTAVTNERSESESIIAVTNDNEEQFETVEKDDVFSNSKKDEENQ